jgi:hypothetical protein
MQDRRESGVGGSSVRINVTLRGKPAELLLRWKSDGVVTSFRDAIVQAIFSLDDRLLERELKRMRIETFRQDDDPSGGEHL